MNPEQAKALREPFPKGLIGKRPQGGKALDYVGHAAVTDRLLTVDPSWSWEPVALTPAGLPLFDALGGLWIRLTVCGVTRFGYGEALGKEVNAQTVKEVIGDAIKNAAMRFGVALDLWSKEDLQAAPDEPAPARAATPPRPGHAVDAARAKMGIEQPAGEPASDKQLKMLVDKAVAKGYATLIDFIESGDAARILGHAVDIDTMTKRDASTLIDAFIKYEKTENTAQRERIDTRRKSGNPIFPDDDPWAGEEVRP